MVRSTTPTSAGLAQVFDLSGSVDYLRDKKMRDNERVEKALMQYDSKGMWDRDIQRLNNKYNTYMEFVRQHPKELANPSDNLEIYMQKQRMEQEMNNLATYSANAKKRWAEAQSKAFDPKSPFYNPKSQTIIADMLRIPTDEEYESGDAWADPNTLLDRSSVIDLNKMAKDFKDTGVVTWRKGKEAAPEGYSAWVKGVAYDEPKMREELKKRYENQESFEGEDLRNQYETFDEFFNAFTGHLSSEEAVQFVKDPTEDDGSGSGKSKSTIMPEGQSQMGGAYATAQGYGTEETTGWFGQKKTKDIKFDPSQKGFTVTYTSMGATLKINDVESIPVTTQLGGMDLSNGTWAEDQFRDMDKADLTDIGIYEYAHKPLFMRMITTDENGNEQYVVQKIGVNQLIPTVAGKVEFFSANGVTEEQLSDKNFKQADKFRFGSSYEDDNKNMVKINRQDFIGSDMFAFVRSSEVTPGMVGDDDLASEKSMMKEKATAKRKAVLKWSDAKGVFWGELSKDPATAERIEFLEDQNRKTRSYSSIDEEIARQNENW